MQMQQNLKLIARQILPAPVHRFLGTQLLGEKYRPPVGAVDFGSLRRVVPISRKFGYDRGLPVDRYYVEKFLSQYRDDVKGRVLEIGDREYTRKFGGDRVTTSDVLHVVEGNPEATFVGDLTCADHIPTNAFDCVILTQTLQFIYDVPAALETIYRILKPGGVVLATFPGLCHIVNDQWQEYQCWSFTSHSARRLFEKFFPAANVEVKTHGNVLTATAFLYGLATEELQPAELDYWERNFEVIITTRAVKPEVKR